MPPFIPAGQKAPDLITDGFEPKCWCWEWNSGPPGRAHLIFSFLSLPFLSPSPSPFLPPTFLSSETGFLYA